MKPAASVAVNASIAIAGEYDVRLRRLDSAAVELGVYNLKSRNLSVGVTAQAGLSAKAGSFDLLERVVAALSPQPVVDVEDFRKALPGEDGPAKDRRISGFQNSLQGALSTKLQAALSLAFSKSRSEEALWLFQIDPDTATSDAASAALGAALAGNFTALTSGSALLPAGIGQLRNVLTRAEVGKQTLRINLLGLLNNLSVAAITQTATIERNAAGDITLITDSANASRLNALLVNLGPDTQRLRKMMSENFLIEAAYHATGLGVLPPEFRSKHTYLEIHENTGRDEMKDNLDVPRVLGVITRAEQERRLGTESRFGRTTLFAELSYTSGAVRSIFLDPDGESANRRRLRDAGQVRPRSAALRRHGPGTPAALRGSGHGWKRPVEAHEADRKRRPVRRAFRAIECLERPAGGRGWFRLHCHHRLGWSHERCRSRRGRNRKANGRRCRGGGR